MFLNKDELVNAFKAFVNRLQQTQVNVTSEEDGRSVQVNRTFSGAFTEEELRQKAIKNEAGIANMQQSEIKFSLPEIYVFLNTAYEKIFNAKMRQVQKMIMDPKVMPTDLEAILHEHHYLTFQSQLIQETTHERFGSSKATGNQVFKGVNEEKTMDNARIFKIPFEYRKFGPITIVSLTIEEFETDNPWFTTDTPMHTRIARPIGNNDLASLGALAKNSRYASGGIYRTKRWMDIHGNFYYVIEVFHNNEEEDKWYNPFDGSYLFISFQYIMHPPKVEDHASNLAIYNTDFDAPALAEAPIPVTYGMEIAKLAAEIALGKGE